jgi:hypothetical protein
MKNDPYQQFIFTDIYFFLFNYIFFTKVLLMLIKLTVIKVSVNLPVEQAWLDFSLVEKF